MDQAKQNLLSDTTRILSTQKTFERFSIIHQRLKKKVLVTKDLRGVVRGRF